ncbi:uncharacterized protein LOC125673025 [Ostrea edulis]|uniref:uncharacterized protein LOC125673025 n=1 Tax=Ostrea edulis TaxID=37623 RepID=UPI0024AFF163|nr:uncharacterized protein LOC125673025 [Ostrea edulis]
MYTFTAFLLVFLIRCSESSSSLNAVIFNEEYMDHKSLDHKTLSGRWYEHLDTLNNTSRDNTYADVMVLCDETISLVYVASRWIPALEECRSAAIRIHPDSADSPEGTVIRISTNETQGKFKTRYYDPHPTMGFVLVYHHTQLGDGYHIMTRQRDPSDLDDVIEQVLSALQMNIRDFYVKSKDFGCERKEEKGIKI